MGRPASIMLGDATQGVRVEHVKSRRLVRLVRWSAGALQDDAVGLDVSDFCSRLGITTDVLSTHRRYLLVADPARPGTGPVVSLFPTSDEARAEFVRFRQAERSVWAWAEVTEISSSNEMRRLCWFSGNRRPVGEHRAAGGARRRRSSRFTLGPLRALRPRGRVRRAWSPSR